MSKFGDLLKNNNKAEENAFVDEKLGIGQKDKPKVNPFAILGKAVGAVKDTSPSVSKSNPTAAAGVADARLPSEATSAAPTDVPSPDTEDVMSGVSGDFSESKSAREFQAEDQPEGYEQIHVDELKTSLDILVNSIDNKEMVGDALKKIMLDLKRYPFLVNIMHPEDCNLMVRAVRESYGVTLAKKQGRSAKRKATSKEVEDTLDILADVEITL